MKARVRLSESSLESPVEKSSQVTRQDTIKLHSRVVEYHVYDSCATFLSYPPRGVVAARLHYELHLASFTLSFK